MNNSLQETLSAENMISINIDPSRIAFILKQLSNKIKEQEARINHLENENKKFLTTEKFRQNNKPIQEFMKTYKEKTDGLINQTNQLDKNLEDSITNLKQLIESKADELLISTTSNHNQAIGNLENTISYLKNGIELFKKDINKKLSANTQVPLANNNSKNPSTDLKNHPKSNSASDSNNKKQTKPSLTSIPIQNKITETNNTNIPIATVSEMDDKSIVENKPLNLFEINPTSSEIIDESQSDFSSAQLHEIYIIAERNRNSIIKYMNEQSTLSKKLDEILLNMKSHSSFKSRSSEDFRSKQPFELQSQNISLSDTNFHRGPFPMSVDIKTFNPRGDKLVHDDGGFDYLPPLNLGQCLPSFFNNPSYTFLRGDASSTSSTSNLVSNERLSTDSSGDNQSQVPIISQKSPHHHHHHHKTLKSNISLLDDISEVSLPKSDKESKSDSNAKSDSEAKSVMNMKSDNIKRLLEDFKSKTLDDFTNILHNEKDELLSAIERKVDRELVDRLFDKIRLLIQNLSDRINEVSKSTEGLATQDDLLILTKAVKTAITSPKKDGDSACVKECLLCGRTRTGVSGHISAKEAKRVGEASVMTAQSGGKMLYGDGAAFYGNSLESLPRFRLPKLSNEHSK